MSDNNAKFYYFSGLTLRNQCWYAGLKELFGYTSKKKEVLIPDFFPSFVFSTKEGFKNKCKEDLLGIELLRETDVLTRMTNIVDVNLKDLLQFHMLDEGSNLDTILGNQSITCTANGITKYNFKMNKSLFNESADYQSVKETIITKFLFKQFFLMKNIGAFDFNLLRRVEDKTETFFQIYDREEFKQLTTLQREFVTLSHHIEIRLFKSKLKTFTFLISLTPQSKTNLSHDMYDTLLRGINRIYFEFIIFLCKNNDDLLCWSSSELITREFMNQYGIGSSKIIGTNSLKLNHNVLKTCTTIDSPFFPPLSVRFKQYSKKYFSTVDFKDYEKMMKKWKATDELWNQQNKLYEEFEIKMNQYMELAKGDVVDIKQPITTFVDLNIESLSQEEIEKLNVERKKKEIDATTKKENFPSMKEKNKEGTMHDKDIINSDFLENLAWNEDQENENDEKILNLDDLDINPKKSTKHLITMRDFYLKDTPTLSNCNLSVAMIFNFTGKYPEKLHQENLGDNVFDYLSSSKILQLAYYMSKIGGDFFNIIRKITKQHFLVSNYIKHSIFPEVLNPKLEQDFWDSRLSHYFIDAQFNTQKNEIAVILNESQSRYNLFGQKIYKHLSDNYPIKFDQYPEDATKSKFFKGFTKEFLDRKLFPVDKIDSNKGGIIGIASNFNISNPKMTQLYQELFKSNSMPDSCLPNMFGPGFEMDLSSAYPTLGLRLGRVFKTLINNLLSLRKLHSETPILAQVYKLLNNSFYGTMNKPQRDFITSMCRFVIRSFAVKISTLGLDLYPSMFRTDSIYVQFGPSFFSKEVDDMNERLADPIDSIYLYNHLDKANAFESIIRSLNYSFNKYFNHDEFYMLAMKLEFLALFVLYRDVNTVIFRKLNDSEQKSIFEKKNPWVIPPPEKVSKFSSDFIVQLQQTYKIKGAYSDNSISNVSKYFAAYAIESWIYHFCRGDKFRTFTNKAHLNLKDIESILKKDIQEQGLLDEEAEEEKEDTEDKEIKKKNSIWIWKSCLQIQNFMETNPEQFLKSSNSNFNSIHLESIKNPKIRVLESIGNTFLNYSIAFFKTIIIQFYMILSKISGFEHLQKNFRFNLDNIDKIFHLPDDLGIFLKWIPNVKSQIKETLKTDLSNNFCYLDGSKDSQGFVCINRHHALKQHLNILDQNSMIDFGFYTKEMTFYLRRFFNLNDILVFNNMNLSSHYIAQLTLNMKSNKYISYYSNEIEWWKAFYDFKSLEHIDCSSRDNNMIYKNISTQEDIKKTKLYKIINERKIEKTNSVVNTVINRGISGMSELFSNLYT